MHEAAFIACLHDTFSVANGQLIYKDGTLAGGPAPNGYMQVTFQGTCYGAHRIVYAITRGHWPEQEIDHKDFVKTNNTPSNLRLATRRQNAQSRRVQSNSKSGKKGVSWNKQRKKWIVQIKTPTERIHLGYFDDIEEAAKVYDTAAKKFFGKFAYNSGVR